MENRKCQIEKSVNERKWQIEKQKKKLKIKSLKIIWIGFWCSLVVAYAQIWLENHTKTVESSAAKRFQSICGFHNKILWELLNEIVNVWCGKEYNS